MMRQNKRENCVIKSRSLSNDAMLRRNKQDECNVFYYINCSVLQGFLPPRNVYLNTRKNTIFLHVKISIISLTSGLSLKLYLNSLVYHRNIFGSSSKVLGNLRKSSDIFGNFRKMFGNVRLVFGTI